MPENLEPFFDLEDGEYKETIKNAEVRMEAAMLCKMGTKKRSKKLQETSSETTESNKKRQSMRASWKLMNYVLDSTIPRDHEDHIAEEGFNSLSHYNLVRKFIPMPKAMKNPDAKAASSGQRM